MSVRASEQFSVSGRTRAGWLAARLLTRWFIMALLAEVITFIGNLHKGCRTRVAPANGKYPLQNFLEMLLSRRNTSVAARTSQRVRAPDKHRTVSSVPPSIQSEYAISPATRPRECTTRDAATGACPRRAVARPWNSWRCTQESTRGHQESTRVHECPPEFT